MTRPRLAMLVASESTEMTRRNFRRELDADLVEFHANGGELPETYDFDGVVVSGSSASAYWDEDWIHALEDYLAGAHERGVPILGVCYGHQALAAALGGRVEAMDDYEIGYRTVTHSGVDELFAGIDEEFLAFTTHGDTVVELPPGATRLAENDYGVHAFRKGHSFGVQFHPEYDMDSARSVTEGKDLAEERIRSVLDGITAENFEAACEVKRLFDNFVDYAERVRAKQQSQSAD
ncbi:MAG: type 1 glutamine amidotransferase [Haloferacaceae archaeon]